MSHSLICADRTSHLKIVAAGLAGAILVVLVGIAAYVESDPVRPQTVVVKAGKRLVAAGISDASIR